MAVLSWDLRAWLADAAARGASHMVVFRESYDKAASPFFVMPGENPRAVFAASQAEYVEGAVNCTIEAESCFDLSLDIEAQIAERKPQNWAPWTVAPTRGA